MLFMGPTSKQRPSLFLSSSVSYIFPKGVSYIASSIQEKWFHQIQILSHRHRPPTWTWREGNVFRGDGSSAQQVCSGREGRRTWVLAGAHTCSLSQTGMCLYLLPPFLRPCSLHPLELSWSHFLFSSPIHSFFMRRFQTASLSLETRREVTARTEKPGFFFPF